MIFSCQQVNTLKEAYAEGTLEPAVRQAITEHIAGCSACRERISLAYSVKNGLNEALRLALGSTVPRQKDLMAMQSRLETRIVASRQMRPLHTGLAAAMLVAILSSIAILSAIRSGQVNQIIKPSDVILIPVPTFAQASIKTATSRPQVLATSVAQSTRIPQVETPPSPNPVDAVALITPIPNQVATKLPVAPTAEQQLSAVNATRMPDGPRDLPRATNTALRSGASAISTVQPKATVRSQSPTAQSVGSTAVPVGPLAPPVKNEPTAQAANTAPARATGLPTGVVVPSSTSAPPTLPQTGTQPLPTALPNENRTPTAISTAPYTATPFSTRNPQQSPTSQATATRVQPTQPAPTREPMRTAQPTSTGMPRPQLTATSTIPQASPTSTVQNTPQITSTVTATSVVVATSTPTMTAIPMETSTVVPSATPAPSNTAEPSNTPSPTFVPPSATQFATRTPRPSATRPPWTPFPTRTPDATHEPPPTGTRPPPPTREPGQDRTPEATCSPEPTQMP